MTQAVCFHCGDTKWGAFNGCDNCGSLPKSDDDLILSLLLTDHNLSADQLAFFGQSIKVGRPPVVPESEKAKLRPAVEEAKRMLGINQTSRERNKPTERKRTRVDRSFKAVLAVIAFVAVYFLTSVVAYVLVLYINGGSVFSLSGWRAFGVAAFANAWAGYLGVVAGLALLDAFLAPYPTRIVGITFIALLGIWFVPLTLVYAIGTIGFFSGEDLGSWPPEGELGQYFLGLTRAIVATICAWLMLVKRQPNG